MPTKLYLNLPAQAITFSLSVIIISILSPNYVIDLDFADTILLAYSYSDFSFQAVAAALAGEIDISGNLPITLPKKED